MRKRRLLLLMALVVVAAAILSFTPSAYANSAQMNWSGISSSGALIVGENCPITVKSEKLVFDIPHFPATYYGEEDKQAISAYDAKVSATYEFENPADYDVNVRLAFPFGAVPSYFYEMNEILSEKYDVTVNGEKVDKKIRYTYNKNAWNDDFVTKEATARLRDEKTSVGWVNGNTNIVTYTYEVSDSPADHYNFYVGMEKNASARIFGDFDSYSSDAESTEYGKYMMNLRTISFYLVYSGEEPELDFRAEKDGKAVNFRLTEIGKSRRTLAEFAEQTYPFKDENESAKTDWFNIVADYVAEGDCLGGRNLFTHQNYFLSENVMLWYEYDLNVAAGAQATNTVTAPLFPRIDTSYVPSIYTYDYLLSPAKDWAQFGTLDIEINTPYFILDAENSGFEKTEEGYKKSFSSLPDGELSFTVSKSAEPQKKPNYYWILAALIITVPAVCMLGIAGVTAIIVLAVNGARRKNALENDAVTKKSNTLTAAGIGFVSSVAFVLLLLMPMMSLIAGLKDIVWFIALTVLFALLAAAVIFVAVKLLYVKKMSKGSCGSEDGEEELQDDARGENR